MAEKKASLTVLGGPLAGTRFVLEGLGAEVLLGSDESCQFQLALAGVSAQHARVRAESDAAFTIEDAGSAHGLHVNDSRVAGPVPLRNGDIVWLGTPGEADVVMLQCILPSRPAASPPPPPSPPEPPLSEDETLALALESEAAPPRTEIIEAEPAPTAFYTVGDANEASGAPFAADTAAAPVPFATAGDQDLVAAEDETVADSAPFVVDSAPPPPPPPHFEDDTREQTYEFEGEQATVVMGGGDAAEPAFVYSTQTGFMDEEAATVVMASEPEPTVALEPPPPAAPEPPPTELIARSPAPPPSVPSSAPVATPSSVSRASAAPPPAAPRAPRPAAPAPSPAPVAAARRPAPRPQPPPRAVADDAESPARAGRSSAPVALYAGLGVAALAALGGGYWAFSKFRGASPPPTAVEAPPTTVAAARPAPPPPAATEAPVVEAPVEVQPETTATPPPTPAAVATPIAGPTTTLRAVPSPLPSPSAPAKKGAATPAPVATPAGPSPEQLRAQQVAALLGQADAALASGQYDQAIGHFDEVLRLDPGNGRATADRASAAALRDASRKKFVAGRTVVKTEKASGGGLAGFEGAEVQRMPDFSGRIEFEMSPASGLKTGDAWTMKYFLVNDGKKAIKIGGVTATTNVNGTGAGGPVASSTREVAPQQRVQLGQITGSWREGTTAWTADVLVTANKGDSLKNTLTWR